LGEELFGLWALTMAVFSSGKLLELGLGITVTKLTAEYDLITENRLISKVINSALLLQFMILAVVMIPLYYFMIYVLHYALPVIYYDLISYYNTPGEIIDLINFSNEKNLNLMDYTLVNFLNLLIDNGYYKKNKFVKTLLINFIELFFLKEYKLSATKNSLLTFYHKFIVKIYNTEKFNLDDESLFLEFKSRLLNG
jgi:hypothetical protein